MKGCVDARAHEKPPCDRSRPVSSLSLYPYYFGDHKGHPTLVSEDTADQPRAHQVWGARLGLS